MRWIGLLPDGVKYFNRIKDKNNTKKESKINKDYCEDCNIHRIEILALKAENEKIKFEIMRLEQEIVDLDEYYE